MATTTLTGSTTTLSGRGCPQRHTGGVSAAAKTSTPRSPARGESSAPTAGTRARKSASRAPSPTE